MANKLYDFGIKIDWFVERNLISKTQVLNTVYLFNIFTKRILEDK